MKDQYDENDMTETEFLRWRLVCLENVISQVMSERSETDCIKALIDRIQYDRNRLIEADENDEKAVAYEIAIKIVKNYL
jgi:hypothetical protein